MWCSSFILYTDEKIEQTLALWEALDSKMAHLVFLLLISCNKHDDTFGGHDFRFCFDRARSRIFSSRPNATDNESPVTDFHMWHAQSSRNVWKRRPMQPSDVWNILVCIEADGYFNKMEDTLRCSSIVFLSAYLCIPSRPQQLIIGSHLQHHRHINGKLFPMYAILACPVFCRLGIFLHWMWRWTWVGWLGSLCCSWKLCP